MAEDVLNLGPPELLECARNRLGAEVRHLQVIGQGAALCGQAGAGGGTFSWLLRWPTCATCRELAAALGPLWPRHEQLAATGPAATLQEAP